MNVTAEGRLRQDRYSEGANRNPLGGPLHRPRSLNRLTITFNYSRVWPRIALQYVYPFIRLIVIRDCSHLPRRLLQPLASVHPLSATIDGRSAR